MLVRWTYWMRVKAIGSQHSGGHLAEAHGGLRRRRSRRAGLGARVASVWPTSAGSEHPVDRRDDRADGMTTVPDRVSTERL
jgi:hypothetical protein